MERTVLPQGITVNGREVFFRDKDEPPYQQEQPITPKHALKKRSIKGRAFASERKPGKLQRVTDTIIYSKERIKQMEYEKHTKEFSDFLDFNYPDVILSNLIPAAIGSVNEWIPAGDIVEIIQTAARGRYRKHSKVTRQTLSFHMSSLWRKRKVVTLFVDRKSLATYQYKMLDMGYIIGPHHLVKIMHQPIPDSFEKLRLQMSETRLHAKTKGVSEKEFNDFLKERFQALLVLKEKRAAKVTESDVPKDKKIPLGNGLQAEKVEAPPYQYRYDPDAKPSQPRKSVDTIANSQQIKKVKFNIKVGFIPISGEIEIS